MQNMKLVVGHFDEFLKNRGLEFSAIIIGGAALNIMDVTDRVTKDMDLIDPIIPDEILGAAVEFAKNNRNFNLDESWLNNGPISIIRDLPNGWRLRTSLIFSGEALQIFTLGRSDLLKTKLYALCDRGIDFNDCLALLPTLEEINECTPWVLKGDGNPLWPERVYEMLKALKQELKIND